MTFGKLRVADWFRYDRFGINVYIKADKDGLLVLSAKKSMIILIHLVWKKL